MGEKNQLTTSSSLQACFVVAHSSGDLTRINFTIAYIQYSLSNLCSAKLTFSCSVRGLGFCGGKKTQVHYVCLVLIVRSADD